MAKLTIELVPQTAWGANLRSRLSKEEWDRVRRYTYKRAGYICEVCGGIGPEWPVECHEVWHYDDAKHAQTLERCIALCPACHAVKHIGRTQICGDYNGAVKHIMAVNGWKRNKAGRHIAKAFETWRERSRHNWTLDLTWLERFNDEAT